jgi:hypothetical protein
MVQKRAEISKKSKQLIEKENKDANVILQELLNIIHPLENPVNVNDYLIIQNTTTMNIENTVMAQVNYDSTVQKNETLQETPKPIADNKTTAIREKNINLEDTMNKFLDQQRNFWKDSKVTIEDFQTLAGEARKKR